MALVGVQGTERASPIVPRRFASRTTILEETFDRILFEGKTLKDIGSRKPKFVPVAKELRTATAFYFSPDESGSWRFGKINPDRIRVARAVAASTAFPLLLPALDDVYTFNKSDGSARSERVTLTDGGVYDNLGLAPLWPDRDPAISVAIPKPDIIIACRAGYGLRLGEPTVTPLGRMTASFYTTLDRAQNAALKRLYDLRSAEKLHAIVLPYLSQVDNRLACAPPDLVKSARRWTPIRLTSMRYPRSGSNGCRSGGTGDPRRPPRTSFGAFAACELTKNTGLAILTMICICWSKCFRSAIEDD